MLGIARAIGHLAKFEEASHHNVFVQMSELNQENKENIFWEETSRWIKYEERKEKGSERWGKAHLSSLAFHSLNNLRRCLEGAIFELDFKADNFAEIADKIVEDSANAEYIAENEIKSE